ncbi:MAG: UbiA family prenyltransferase, partial [Candidatus Thermoplasmatota archaeon]|nr:UbiA family prenyltransferase [Candidatus Thermoplasmatota archaeon]
LFTMGFSINAVADYDIDRNYATFKSELPEAVEIVGKRGMWFMIAAQTIAANILAAHISYMMGSLIPLGLVLMGSFFGIAYSVHPFRFKERGVLHAISLSTSAFFLPSIFMMYVIMGTMTQEVFIFFLGFGILHYGMEFGNQAIDYFEDKSNNVKTPPVRWGLRRSLWIGMILMILGLAIELAMVPALFGPRLAASSSALSLLSYEVWLFIFGALVAGGYILPLVRTSQMIKESRLEHTPDTTAVNLKRLCKYSNWQTSGIMGIAVATAILFFAPFAFPLVSNVPPGPAAGEFAVSVQMGDFNFESGEDGIIATIPLELSPSKDVGPGELMVRYQSFHAGRLVGEESVVIEMPLGESEVWAPIVSLRCNGEENTSFRVQVVHVERGEETLLWVEKLHSVKPVYIVSSSYSIIQNPGIGSELDKKANVTINLYVDRSMTEAYTLQVESFYPLSNYDHTIDVKNIELAGPFVEGDTMTVFVEIDIPDIGSPRIHLLVTETISGSTVDEKTMQ